MPDDSSLLHDFLEHGSGAAFASIVSRYLPMVYGTALRTLAGDTHAADDVAQQTFVALIANAGRLTQNRSIAGWLHGTAHNIAVNRIRSDRRRADREKEAVLREDRNAAVSAIGDESSIRPVLDAALKDLSSLERELILLRYFQGWDYAEIARFLSVSEEGTRKRIERTLPKLRDALRRRGVPSMGSALAATLSSEAALSVPAGLAASIVGATGPAIGIAAATAATVTLMTTTTKICLAAAVALAISGVVGTVHFKRQNDSTRASLDQTTTSLREAESQARQLQTQLAQRSQSAPEAHRVVAPPIVVEAKPNTERPASEESEEARIDRLVVNNPELQQLYVRQFTVRTAEKYGALYRKLGLQPGQVARFEGIMANHAQGTIDVRIAGLTQGAQKGDSAVKTLQQQIAKERDDAIRELLGDAGLELYRDYETTSVWRGAAAQLAGRLYDTSEPLTGSQADRLVDLLAARSAASSNRNPLQGELGSVTLELAKEFLTERQLAAVRNWKDQIDTGQKVWAIVNPANDKTKGGGGPG